MGVGGPVLVAHVEQRLEIALLHVFAEECGVALAQREARLGPDAAQLVARLHDQRVQQAHPLGVLLQIAQRRDDDRQRYEPLLPVDDREPVAALAHQDQGPEEIRGVRGLTGFVQIVDQLEDVFRLPDVRALE